MRRLVREGAAREEWGEQGGKRLRDVLGVEDSTTSSTVVNKWRHNIIIQPLRVCTVE